MFEVAIFGYCARNDQLEIFHFHPEEVNGMFELVLQNDEIKVAEERHYQLIPAERLNPTAIRNYNN